MIRPTAKVKDGHSSQVVSRSEYRCKSTYNSGDWSTPTGDSGEGTPLAYVHYFWSSAGLI